MAELLALLKIYSGMYGVIRASIGLYFVCAFLVDQGWVLMLKVSDLGFISV